MRSAFLFLVLALSLCVLTSCSQLGYYRSKTPEWVAENSKVATSEKGARVVSPSVREAHRNAAFVPDERETRLLGLRNGAEQEEIFQILITDRHNGRTHPYRAIYDDEETRLEQVKFRGHLDCRFIGACRRREEIEITVPRSYLEARRDTGVVLKLRGFELARVVPFNWNRYSCF